MSLHQKVVQLLGDVSTLAVSIRLMLLGRQTKKRKGNEGVRCPQCSRPVHRCSGMSAAGDVDSHPATATKRSSPDVNVSPRTNMKGFIHTGEADIFERHVSILFYRAVSSAICQIELNCQLGGTLFELLPFPYHFHNIL